MTCGCERYERRERSGNDGEEDDLGGDMRNMYMVQRNQ